MIRYTIVILILILTDKNAPHRLFFNLQTLNLDTLKPKHAMTVFSLVGWHNIHRLARYWWGVIGGAEWRSLTQFVLTEMYFACWCWLFERLQSGNCDEYTLLLMLLKLWIGRQVYSDMDYTAGRFRIEEDFKNWTGLSAAPKFNLVLGNIMRKWRRFAW